MAAVTIEVLRFFVPCTDHRPILTSTVLIPPPHLDGLPVLPDDIPPTVFAPHFRHPPGSERHWLVEFQTLVDDHLASCSDIPHQVSNDDEFQQLYHILSSALHHAGSQVFKTPSRYPKPPKKPTNPTIRLIIKERKQVNRLLSAN
jgi:hypothetical protein